MPSFIYATAGSASVPRLAIQLSGPYKCRSELAATVTQVDTDLAIGNSLILDPSSEPVPGSRICLESFLWFRCDSCSNSWTGLYQRTENFVISRTGEKYKRPSF